MIIIILTLDKMYYVNITIPFSASFTCKNVSDLFVTK
jgi:hypothetical protein